MQTNIKLLEGIALQAQALKKTISYATTDQSVFLTVDEFALQMRAHYERIISEQQEGSRS